jgi:ATP-dependent Zn protease
MTASIGDEREATARHEAGHAVAAYFLDHTVDTVTIEPSDDFAGTCHSRPDYGEDFAPDVEIDPAQYVMLLDDIVVCFAGHEAEAAYRGRHNWHGSRRDREIAIDLASRLCGSPEALAPLLKWRRVVARQFVKARSEEIHAVADALLVRTTLTGSEVREVITGALMPGLAASLKVAITGAES